MRRRSKSELGPPGAGSVRACRGSSGRRFCAKHSPGSCAPVGILKLTAPYTLANAPRVASEAKNYIAGLDQVRQYSQHISTFVFTPALFVRLVGCAMQAHDGDFTLSPGGQPCQPEVCPEQKPGPLSKSRTWVQSEKARFRKRCLLRSACWKRISSVLKSGLC